MRTDRAWQGYYNGFSPAERGGTLAAIRAAIADGRMPAPIHCSVCRRRTETPLQFHSEDYRRPLDAVPICRGCHVRVHARFRHPDRWRAYIGGLDAEGWFQCLTLDPRSLARPYDETYPLGVPASTNTGLKPPNELIKRDGHVGIMDAGTAGETGRRDPPLAAVDPVDRAGDGGGQGGVVAQRRQGRAPGEMA